MYIRNTNTHSTVYKKHLKMSPKIYLQGTSKKPFLGSAIFRRSYRDITRKREMVERERVERRKEVLAEWAAWSPSSALTISQNRPKTSAHDTTAALTLT